MGRVSSTAASTLKLGSSSPTIQNISVTAATEETVILPSGTVRFIMRLRDCQGFEIRTTAAAPTYYTVDCGNDYRESGLTATSTYTFYITPETTGTLEVLSWS